jgi:beta-glucanase (GH16 family)
MPDLIDTKTPQDARARTGFDGQAYDLVFSDEFNTSGQTFYPGEFLSPRFLSFR